MSNAKQDLAELIEQALQFEFQWNELIQPGAVATCVLNALTANEVTEGWLISGKRILKVEETSLTDPGDENWAYEVYCTPPEDAGSDDEETED